MNKVVITGMGAITAIGNSHREYWENLIAGKSGIQAITRIPTDKLDTSVAAQIDDGYETLVKKYWKRRALAATTKGVRAGLASVGEAVEDCGVDFANYDTERVAVIYGVINTGYYCDADETSSNQTLKDMPNALPALVSIRYGLHGASFNLSTACASSANAAALGKQLIESGVYDMVIVGGISSMVSYDVIHGFNQLLAMSSNPDPETACRPFTKGRDGFVMGEGAGTLILESEAAAKRRGAHIYCELAGAGIYSEGFHVTAPQTDGIGMAKALRMALADADIAPEEVDYINAHGTSTNLNDLYETKAIHEVFGEAAKKIAVSSTKSAIGHTLGAGGALEAIACIKAIESGILPPTLHYDEADPMCDLDYVPNIARKAEVRTAISNSFGFGGHNAVLVLRKYEEA